MTRKPLAYRELELAEICIRRESTATNMHRLTGMATSQACVTLGKLERDGVLQSFKRGAERLFYPTPAGVRKITRSREWWAGRTYHDRRR